MLRRGKKNKVEKGRLKKKKKDSSKNEGGSQKQSDQIWRIFSQLFTLSVFLIAEVAHIFGLLFPTV
jgi:hypothetical protein